MIGVPLQLAAIVAVWAIAGLPWWLLAVFILWNALLAVYETYTERREATQSPLES